MLFAHGLRRVIGDLVIVRSITDLSKEVGLGTYSQKNPYKCDAMSRDLRTNICPAIAYFLLNGTG